MNEIGPSMLLLLCVLYGIQNQIFQQWKNYANQVIRRVPENEIISILTFYHSYACGGHFGAKRTVKKVLECGFYWPSLF